MNDSIDSHTSTENFWKIFLLTLFLGIFGVHRFVTGKIKSGLIQLFTCGGLGIWALVDLIFVLTGNFKDKNGLLIKNTHPKASVAIALAVVILSIAANGNRSNGGSSGSSSYSSSTSQTKKGRNDGYDAKNYASDYLKRYGKVIQIDNWGWDEGSQCHVFGGLIDDGTSGNYLHFDIRITPDSSGSWNVASKEIVRQ